MPGRRWIPLPLVLMLAFAMASVVVRGEAERQVVDVVMPDTHVDLPVSYVRMLALEHDSALADFLWIRFIQNVPFKPADDVLGRSLAQQLESVVALDPAFRTAYTQGTVLLSVLGNQPCSAVAIAEKGIERFPDDWRIPFQAGYNCFAEIGDPLCASRHMSYAATLPGSPPWLPALVARLLADASQNDAAIEYLQVQLQRTTDERLRGRFEERLVDAVLARDLSRIETAARRHRAERGALPASLEALVTAGYLDPAPPLDPFGQPYELLPDGRARSSSGRAGLRTFTRQAAFNGDLSERLFAERLAARLFGLADAPFFVRLPRLDALARGEVGEGTAKAIAVVLDHVVDADRRVDLQVLQARALLRRDVDELREARLELLREGARSDDLEAIRARAGVLATDPFGTPYRMFEGLPAPGVGRNPLVAISSTRGSDRCR